MRRAGPGERGGGSYGRRTVATSKRAAMQISEAGKGLNTHACLLACQVVKCACALDVPAAAYACARAVLTPTGYNRLRVGHPDTTCRTFDML